MDHILVLIEQYGYLIVFLGVMLESVGVPVPGETILIASGILGHQGYLGLEDALVFGVLGAVIGDQIGFWVGREGGRPFVLRWAATPGSPPNVSSERSNSTSATGARRSLCPVSLSVIGLGETDSRYKPDALANLPLLQRPRRRGLGHGGGTCWVSAGRARIFS